MENVCYCSAAVSCRLSFSINSTERVGMYFFTSSTEAPFCKNEDPSFTAQFTNIRWMPSSTDVPVSLMIVSKW